MKPLYLLTILCCFPFMLNAQAVTCTGSGLQSDWQNISPYQNTTSNQGRVIALWVSPTDPDFILAGTRSSGLWKTTDGGDNWTNLTGHSLPATGVKAIAVKPDDPDIIYVATSFHGSDISIYNIGMAYSTDGGATWTVETGYPASETFGIDRKNISNQQEIIFNPANPNELFVAAGSSFYKKNISTGLWQGIVDFEPGDDVALISEIDISPVNSNIIILTVGGGINAGVYYTVNGGITWGSLSIPAITLPSGADLYEITASSCFKLSGDKLYVLFKGLAYDTDTDPWTFSFFYQNFCEYLISGTTITLNRTLIHDFEEAGDWFNGITDLTVFPGVSNRCLIGRGQSTVFYADIQATGSTIDFISASSTGGNVHIDIRDVKLYYDSATGQDEIFIATDGGINKLSDLTGTIETGDWENLNGYGLFITESLSLSNSEFQRLGYQTVGPDGNNYLARDGLFTRNFSGDGSRAAITKTHDNLLLYSLNSGSVAANANFYVKKIGTWLPAISAPEEPRSNGITTEQFSFSQQPFKFEPQNDYCWTGSSDVFRNMDAFQTSPILSDWENFSRSFFSLIPLAQIIDDDIFTTRPISAFEFIEDVSAEEVRRIYYATIDKKTGVDDVKVIKIIYEDVLGTIEPSSHNITPGSISGESTGYNQMDHSWISDILIDKLNPDRLWISLGGMDIQLQNVYSNSDNAKNGRVYYSSNAGVSWTNVSEGLPDYPVLDLCYWDNSDDIIFAGTDVGVYVWNATEDEWQCFDTDDKMPYASVNELEINYCTMTLRASTFGFGIWETPLPLGTHFSRAGAPALEITSDITWTQSNDVGRDIRIKPGATLTIQNCEIRMPKEHSIIVERGASLILDNATLINYCEAWSGIEVWGNTSKPHPLVTNVLNGTYPSALDDQGVVYLKNNSKIVNAETGISTYKTTPEGNDAAYNGGIIIAEDASLINNQLAVRFMPYDYPVGGLYDTDDDNISYFKNCVFNINTEYILEDNSAYQIYMWDVDGIKFLGCDFSNELLQTDVTQRGEAIYSVDATYTVSNYCTDLYSPCGHYDNSQFSGFFRAIEAANTKYLPLDITVTYNIFENNQRGVLLSNVKNSSVFLNSYLVPDHASTHNYGTYLEQSEGYRVEENTFTGYGSLSGSAPYNTGLYVGNNSTAVTQIYKNYFNNLEAGIRSQTLNKKLQIKCSTFDAIAFFNLYVTSGELENQGKCLNASYPLTDRVQSPAGNVFSHEVDPNGDIKVLSAAEPFIYRHHIDLAPVYYQTSKVTLDQCNVYSTDGESCPTYLGGSGTAIMMMSMANEIEEVIDVITSEIDAIAFSESEFTVEELEEDLSIFESEKEYYTTEAVDLYITEQKPDSAIAVLQNEEAQWAKHRLVEVYMLTNDYENASAQLKTLPTDELASQDFVSLMEVVINMRSDGRTLDSLTEKEFVIIESLQGKQSPSGIAAENILQLINKIDIPEVFDAEEAEEDMRYANTEITSAIKIFPNPTDNELFIDLTAITETQIPIRIVIYNLIGNKILEQELFGGEIQKILLQNFSTGIYLLQCYQENKLLHTEKVLVD
ncbi:MAG: T9SS type A sorting domain-containing protein [Chitinophagales bacterium]|nr:T9SS type A sorting domain-containing protein [Chitinophagales bacterium]